MKLHRPKVQFDKAKLLEAVYLVCSSADPGQLGNVKLHKILYFADMMRFLETGNPITGVEYVKQKMGPTARHLAWALNKLHHDGFLSISDEEFHGYIKKRYDTRKKYLLHHLSEDEKNMLRESTEYFCKFSARKVSEISHNEAWRTAKLGDVIPYHTVYRLLPVELDDDDLEWAKKEAGIHALAQ